MDTRPPQGVKCPGVGGIVAALGALYFDHGDRTTVVLTSAATVFLIVGLAITVIVHFPINDLILGWDHQAPPADWQVLRDRWTSANLIRTGTALVSFVLLLQCVGTTHEHGTDGRGWK